MTVDVAVLEQAPELQVGQQEDVVRRTGATGEAEFAVETKDEPQLHVLAHHHRLHLRQHRHSVRRGTAAERRHKGGGADLHALSLTVSLWDLIQENLDVESHVRS